MRAVYLLYYALISKLPHSRYGRLFNVLRVWYASRIMKVMAGDRSSFLEHGVYLSGPGNVCIGRHCHINENVFIQGATIGACVMIAPGVSILSVQHKTVRVDVPMIEQGAEESHPAIIEDDVWIGRNAVVMPGIRIRRGSVVGAGAVVTRDVPENAVVGGVPAKVIRIRT